MAMSWLGVEPRNLLKPPPLSDSASNQVWRSPRALAVTNEETGLQGTKPTQRVKTEEGEVEGGESPPLLGLSLLLPLQTRTC